MTSGLPDWRTGVDILAQTLATITAEVTATALDIRALNSSDIPHEALPYNNKSVTKSNTSAINSAAEFDFDYQASDWGANKDFYLKGINPIIEIPLTAYVRYYEGFLVWAYEIAGGDQNDVYYESLNPRRYPAARTSTTSSQELDVYLRVPITLIDSASTLRIRFYNYTEVQLAISKVNMNVVGVAI